MSARRAQLRAVLPLGRSPIFEKIHRDPQRGPSQQNSGSSCSDRHTRKITNERIAHALEMASLKTAAGDALEMASPTTAAGDGSNGEEEVADADADADELEEGPPPADDQSPPKSQAEIDAIFAEPPSMHTCAAGTHCRAIDSTLNTSHKCACCGGRIHAVLTCGSFYRDIGGVLEWMWPSKLRETMKSYTKDEEGRGVLQICGMCVFKLHQLVMRHGKATKPPAIDESEEDEDDGRTQQLSDEQVANIAVETEIFMTALQEVAVLKQPSQKQQEKGVTPRYVYKNIAKLANSIWKKLKPVLPASCQKINATRAKEGITQIIVGARKSVDAILVNPEFHRYKLNDSTQIFVVSNSEDGGQVWISIV